jgi:hypothetical protein
MLRTVLLVEHDRPVRDLGALDGASVSILDPLAWGERVANVEQANWAAHHPPAPAVEKWSVQAKLDTLDTAAMRRVEPQVRHVGLI